MNREKNIDFLKVIACLFVVTLHVTVSYLVNSIESGGFNLFSSTIISVFTRISVPIFVMISGRYLIKNYTTKKDFYIKKLPRALVPLIFWNILYTLFRFIFEPNLSISLLLKDILMGGASIHLWYLYLLVLLYILTPFIVDIKNKLPIHTFRNLNILILFIGFLCEGLRMAIGFLNIPLYYPVEFLGYFLMGFILKDYKVKSPYKFLSLFFLLCLFGGVLSIYLLSIGNNFAFYFHTSLNPPVLLGSLSLYIFFNNIQIRESKFSEISKYTFGIYGIHILILSIVSNLVTINNALFGIVLVTSLTFILSLLICILLRKISFMKKIIS